MEEEVEMMMFKTAATPHVSRTRCGWRGRDLLTVIEQKFLLDNKSPAVNLKMQPQGIETTYDLPWRPRLSLQLERGRDTVRS